MTGHKRLRIRQIRNEINVVSWSFLVLAIVLAVVGWLLQNRAFPKSGSSPFANVSATVYTSSSKARVLLQSTIQPNSTRGDTPGSTYATPSGSSASCFTNLPQGAAATQYKIPQSVTTAETLTSVSLSGDRIDSMFPPGQITSNDEIIWQGTSGLSPSLSATNLSSAENSSKAGFLAGLLYGLAAGLFIPFLQDVSQAVKATSSPREAAREEAATGR